MASVTPENNAYRLRNVPAFLDTLTRILGYTIGQHPRIRSDQALRKRARPKTRAKTRSAKSTKVNCTRKFVFLTIVRTVLFGNGNFQQANCYGFVHCSNCVLCCLLSAWYGGWVPHPVCSRQPYISSMLDCRIGREHFKGYIFSHST